jgi:hypothetical protein
MPWVQPYPDSLRDEVAADQPGPEAVAVSRETISLAYLALAISPRSASGTADSRWGPETL